MPKVGLIFKFQTRGLETWGQYSTDLRLIFVFFFVHSPSSQRGIYRKGNAERIATEMNIFLCFIFVFSWSHSGWPYSRWTTTLAVVTKDLPISPRFTPYDLLSSCKLSTLTTRQLMVGFYLLAY